NLRLDQKSASPSGMNLLVLLSNRKASAEPLGASMCLALILWSAATCRRFRAGRLVGHWRLDIFKKHLNFLRNWRSFPALGDFKNSENPKKNTNSEKNVQTPV